MSGFKKRKETVFLSIFFTSFSKCLLGNIVQYRAKPEPDDVMLISVTDGRELCNG